MFIDFGSILTNPVLANRYQLTVQNVENGLLPSVCIEPIAKPKKTTCFVAWLSSFHIFVGVYTKRFPHEAPTLLKYCETIQDLAENEKENLLNTWIRQGKGSLEYAKDLLASDSDSQMQQKQKGKTQPDLPDYSTQILEGCIQAVHSVEVWKIWQKESENFTILVVI